MLNNNQNSLTKLKYVVSDDNDSKNYLNKGFAPYQFYNNDNFNNSTRLLDNKYSKESDLYWDNTKRRNLDTSKYINNPNKVWAPSPQLFTIKNI